MKQASGRRPFRAAALSAVVALTAATAGLFVPSLAPGAAYAEEEAGPIRGPAAPAEHEYLQ